MNINYPKFPVSQTKNWVKLDVNNVISIIVHNLAAMKAATYDVNAWHLARGWNGGVGYGEIIFKDGDVDICRDLHIGAHCQGQNSKSYGIAIEGNYDKETYIPPAQMNSLVERIKYNISRFPNYVATFPHSYFGRTNCPGVNFPFGELLKRIEEKEVDEALLNCVNLLAENGHLKSPDYWLNNSVYKTEYVQQLIKTFANYVYTQTSV